MVWYSHVFQNFPQLIVIHTVKGFGIVNKADDTALMAESKEELKSLLMKVKEESGKAVLKLSILEKEMATHSSILAWEIPWTDKPGGLQSMGSQRVRHD